MSALCLRFFTLVLILILCTIQLKAQSQNEVPADFKRPLLTLKIVPLPLMDLTPAAQLAVELRTADLQSFQLEYGYIFGNISTNRQSDFQGFKLKGEYRFYRKRPENILKGQFIGVQYMHKQLRLEGSAAFWRANQSYQEILPIELINITNSAYFIFGRQFPLFGDTVLELSAGTGVRVLHTAYVDLPDGVIEVDPPNRPFNFIFNNDAVEGVFLYPAILASLKIAVPLIK